jgi:hypothetical protein
VASIGAITDFGGYYYIGDYDDLGISMLEIGTNGGIAGNIVMRRRKA